MKKYCYLDSRFNALHRRGKSGLQEKWCQLIAGQTWVWRKVSQKTTANIIVILVRVKMWGKSLQSFLVTKMGDKPHQEQDQIETIISSYIVWVDRMRFAVM